MINTVRALGDNLLARLVPKLDAHAACTPAEKDCTCHPDVEGQYTNCQWCQMCNGQYRCWGGWSYKGC